jgi:LmbE family N-acetylglucosaminyl deacetylase
MSKTVVIAMAHADDMEVYAGGTVAKLVHQGYRAVLVMLTNNIAGADVHGDGEFMRHTPEQVAPIREEEAHEGARILGVDAIVNVGFKDAVYYTGDTLAFLGDAAYDVHHPAGQEPLPAAAANMKCIARVQSVLEKYDPQIVITHNFTSGFEHTCVAHIVNQAFGQAVKDDKLTGSLWIPTHVRHSAWETDVRLFASPNVLIDVTDYWALKVKAIRAHRSQQMEKSIKKVELIARYWGIARQCLYAEPFFTIYDARYR